MRFRKAILLLSFLPLGSLSTAHAAQSKVGALEPQIARLPSTPSETDKEEVLRLLAGFSTEERIEAVRVLPFWGRGEFVLEALSHDPDRDVRLAVALNWWTPSETLHDLRETDEDEDVRLCAEYNLVHARTALPLPTERLEPCNLRIEDNPYIKDRESSRQNQAANSLDGLVLRAYRTIPEATADLERVLSPWEDYPHVAYAGFTNAVGQVRGKLYAGTADREEVGAFLSEAILRTSVLPIPTNRVRSVSWRYAGWRREMQSMSWDADRAALPATLAPKVADLCARARARQERFGRLRDEWKAKEPPDLLDAEGFRIHNAWQERMWFLEDRYRWAAGDREFLHLRLFQHFTHNWYEPALAGLTPERRLEARLSLLRRANVDPGAMESLGDTARAAYRLETHARERELAPGAPGAD